ncbi:MAG: AAA family ATPase [Bacteroidales bacterium]
MHEDNKNFEISLNSLAESAEVKQPLNPENLLIKITDEIQEPFPLFAVLFKIIGSPGNLICVKAKQKAGKTYLICVFFAAYYAGEYLALTAKKTPDKKFYWLDSEQSKSQVFKVLKRGFQMAGLLPFTHKDFGIYYLSELTIQERWEILEQLAAREDCEVLAVDVMTDFVNDPNDLRETKTAADRLQAIAKKYNIVIIATIHENKDNNHATGHLGSALMKKGETVLTLEKRNEVFTVSSPYARHGDIEPFSFVIDENGLPVESDLPIMMTKSAMLNENIKNRLNKILALKRLRHTDLMELYIDNFGVSEKTAKSHISRALEMDLIFCEEKHYQLKNTQNED